MNEQRPKPVRQSGTAGQASSGTHHHTGATRGLPAHASAHHCLPTRRGISLLEVLIATFVAAVGLLSLASLIPVGKYQINEGAKNDRGSTMGRAAVRELQVRGILDPHNWLPVTAGAFASPAGPWLDWDYRNQPQLPSSPTDWGNSICIDPLFLARQDVDNNGVYDDTNPQSLARISQFPIPLAGEDGPLKSGGLDYFKSDNQFPNPPRMTRVALRGQPLTQPLLAFNNTARMSGPLADRIFTLEDDLLFEKPDTDTRTQQLFVTNGSGGALYRQYLGDYTWLVTLTPAETGNVASSQRKLYTVSVVVFYKRSMLPSPTARVDRTDGPPSERLVMADLLSGSLGYGGGDVRLWLPNQWAAASQGNPTDMPYTHAGEWLMLAHWVPDKNNPLGNPLGARAVYHWYRVVATEGAPVVNASTGQPEQYVSLVGPDLDPKANGPTVHAALFDGVVAVYQKTMRLN